MGTDMHQLDRVVTGKGLERLRIALLWAPKTCSTRTRTDERVLLPCFSRSLSGLLRRPLRWIRLRNPFSFSAASISAER